jgi:hypothetical protein
LYRRAIRLILGSFETNMSYGNTSWIKVSTSLHTNNMRFIYIITTTYMIVHNSLESMKDFAIIVQLNINYWAIHRTFFCKITKRPETRNVIYESIVKTGKKRCSRLAGQRFAVLTVKAVTTKIMMLSLEMKTVKNGWWNDEIYRKII